MLAADGGFFVGRERSGNLPPGGAATLSIETATARRATRGTDRFPARIDA